MLKVGLVCHLATLSTVISSNALEGGRQAVGAYARWACAASRAKCFFWCWR